MPNYNFSQLTETVMNACASVNRLCEIVKSLEARIIVEKSSYSQEQQQQGSIVTTQTHFFAKLMN